VRRSADGWSLAAKPERKCRVCPRRATDLHHAIPRSVGPPETKLDFRNGLPLCQECHTGWHRRTLVIFRHVFTPDEWAYLTAVKLTGRETDAWLDDHYPDRYAQFPPSTPPSGLTSFPRCASDANSSGLTLPA
jgi:HNH endonuclease